MPEPERRQHVHGRVLRPAVVHGHLEQEILRCRLRVFDLDVEVPALIEDPGVEQFVFGLRHAACAVDGNQVGIGKLGLRILVQHPQV